jgi:hypothetical protein
MLRRLLEIQHRQGQVMQIVRTLRAASRFTSGLDRRQEQRNQDANDRDHDQ